ncbi:hypothetical protein BgiBS90_005191 [Biomphalaria glabrata]|nr:hypothetical protein BgiBS90_005191 [Biomphalaria glabrata]
MTLLTPLSPAPCRGVSMTMDSKVSKQNCIPEYLFGDTLPVSLGLWTKVSKLNFIPEYLLGDTLPVSLGLWTKVSKLNFIPEYLFGDTLPVSLGLWTLKCPSRTLFQSTSLEIHSQCL